MAICLVCPYCKHAIPMPDGEAKWRDYAETGQAIRTFVARIVAQPIIKRYETPQPVLKAIAIGIPIVAIGSSFAMYYEVNPLTTAIIETAAMAVLFFWASSKLEMTELDDEELDDEPEDDEPVNTLEQVTRTHNSMSIKILYTPPEGKDPQATQRLGKAAHTLAQLAAREIDPLEPISFDNAKSAGFKFGERTFAVIQSDWRSKGLAFLDQRGWCFLTRGGHRILSMFASPTPPLKSRSLQKPPTCR